MNELYQIKYKRLEGLKGTFEDIAYFNVSEENSLINIYFGDSSLNPLQSKTIDLTRYEYVIIHTETKELYRYTKEQNKVNVNKIVINYFYREATSGQIKEDSKVFYSKEKALRFLYATKSSFKKVWWLCDDPEDNNYLWYKFH